MSADDFSKLLQNPDARKYFTMYVHSRSEAAEAELTEYLETAAAARPAASSAAAASSGGSTTSSDGRLSPLSGSSSPEAPVRADVDGLDFQHAFLRRMHSEYFLPLLETKLFGQVRSL